MTSAALRRSASLIGPHGEKVTLISLSLGILSDSLRLRHIKGLWERAESSRSDSGGLSSLQESGLMGRRRAGAQFSRAIIPSVDSRRGPKLDGRALIELGMLLVPVRSVLDDVLEPIRRAFSEIDGIPGCEGEPPDACGEEAGLVNAR